MKHNIITYGLTAVLLSGIPKAKAEITCTATPDCTTLGYTKTASDCPDGGVKCPFNSTKMFCLKKGGNVEFSIKNKINNLDVVYSDGTSSASYNSNKIPIGVAIVTETNSAYNHGIIFQLDQPRIATRAEAIKYCENHVTNGTSEGDWKLPNLYEVMYIMGWETNESSVSGNTLAQLNSKLQTVRGADWIGKSYAYVYNQSGVNQATNKYCIQGESINTCGTNTAVSSNQLWLTDETQNAGSYYIPYLDASANSDAKKIMTNAYMGYYALFRCVLRF